MELELLDQCFFLTFSSWLRPQKVCWMLEKDMLSWSEIFLGHIKTCSLHFSNSDYGPFCFGLFWVAFILPGPYPPTLTKTHTIPSWKMGSFFWFCLGWERNLLAVLNTVVENTGVLSDFKVIPFFFSLGMLYTFATEISDLKCLWSYWVYRKFI